MSNNTKIDPKKILDEMVAGIQMAFATLNISPSYSSYAGCQPISWGATPLKSSLNGGEHELRRSEIGITKLDSVLITTRLPRSKNN